MNLANKFSLIRLLLTPFFVWAILYYREDHLLFANLPLVIFLIAVMTDAIDGFIARRYRQTTRFGAVLDPLADKFLVVGALVQFWAMGLVNIWLVGVIVVRDVWVTVLRIAAIKKGKDLKTSRDAKLKTTIQLIVVITIIVFTGGRIIAVHLGDIGPWINPNGFRILFNGLVSVAVIFTVYSWFKYILKIRTA